jgi:hypothetical protein
MEVAAKVVPAYVPDNAYRVAWEVKSMCSRVLPCVRSSLSCSQVVAVAAVVVTKALATNIQSVNS